MCDVGAVVRPRNRPLLGVSQIVVGRNVELLKHLSRPRSDGLQSEVGHSVVDNSGQPPDSVMPPP